MRYRLETIPPPDSADPPAVLAETRRLLEGKLRTPPQSGVGHSRQRKVGGGERDGEDEHPLLLAVKPCDTGTGSLMRCIFGGYPYDLCRVPGRTVLLLEPRRTSASEGGSGPMVVELPHQDEEHILLRVLETAIFLHEALHPDTDIHVVYEYEPHGLKMAVVEGEGLETVKHFFGVMRSEEGCRAANLLEDAGVAGAGLKIVPLPARRGAGVCAYASERQASILVVPGPRRKAGLLSRLFPAGVELVIQEMARMDCDLCLVAAASPGR